ncbi:MAG: hypothetical protein ACO3LM_12645 [Steroidobacteraceae bacterium]|jgi:hypothetical protein
MAILQQALDKLGLIAGHPTAARTATGQTSGIDLQTYDGDVVFLLDSAAGTGTSPTLDVTIEDSADNSSFAAITGAAFTQVTGTASAQKLVVNKDSARRYVRVKYTIGGTSPSFTFSVNAVGVTKYG